MSPRRVAKALAGLGAIALAALVGVTIYVVRSRPTVQNLTKIADLVPNSLLHVHNFKWTQMKAGEKQWILNADDANYSSDKRSVILTEPRVTMTSTDGKIVTISAARAVLAMENEHVTRADLTGGTVIHYGEFTLTTAEAVFMPDADHVEAPGAVTIEGGGLKVTGVGLTGNPKTRQFDLREQVVTQIAPKHAQGKPNHG